MKKLMKIEIYLYDDETLKTDVSSKNLTFEQMMGISNVLKEVSDSIVESLITRKNEA